MKRTLNRSRWSSLLGLTCVAGLVGVVGALSTGCAAERDPINRVQPNALEKSFFVGADLRSSADDPEFYMRNTIVDVPYGAGQDGLFTATYAQPVNRIKWEVTEQNLVARMTHERITNSDFHGSKRTNDGQVVAMFKIEKHFDVRRDYNSGTGEETNVVVENDSDRPWYDRKYIRVDWSKNLVTDGYQVDTASMLGLFGGVKWSPLSYYVQDPNSPDAPVFSSDQGYFDITSKAYATPQMIHLDGYGDLPACFLYGQYPVANCNATEVTLRLSFKKVVDTDFEPSEWTGNKMDAFGAFTEDRFGYDRNYGVVDDRWHRFIAKYNVWEKSHIEGSQCAVDQWRDDNGNVQNYRVDGNGKFLLNEKGLPIADASGKPYSRSRIGANVHRDDDGDGTEDECQFNADSRGSRCDEFSKKCTIPVHKRTTKTIPWYFGPGSQTDLFPSTADALSQWNVATRRALQIAKSVEAKRVGADASKYILDEARIAADIKGELVPHIFVLCHNPVVAGDDASCGAPGLAVRVGDLRYNMVNLITSPQTPSPWGIMVDAVDPLTGEKLAGSANEWIYVLDNAAQGTVDLMRWFNGEISDRDVYSGDYLKDWVESSKLGTLEYAPKVLDKAEIKSRVKALSVAGKTSPATLPTDWKRTATDSNVLRAASERLSKATGPSLDTQFEATRKALIGSPIEQMMITPDMLQAAGFDPKTPVAGNDEVVKRASPFRGMNRGLRQWLDQQKAASLARNGACIVEQPEPNSIAGLARRAQALFPVPEREDPNYPALKHARDQKLHQWVRTQMHLGVIAHELGHSMGLRHNFTGSWDSLNYFPEYWQLRTNNGAEKACKASDGADYGFKPHADGHECVGPRWVDPVTEEEVNGLVWKWGSTTVMDYPGDVSQDFNGLGPYDKAAVRFFYGETVDVEPGTELDPARIDEPVTSRNPLQTRTTDPAMGAKREDMFYQLEWSSFFYPSEKHYSEFQDAYNVLGECTPATDPKDPLTAKCTGPKLDFAALRDMHDEATSGGTIKHFAADPQGRIRHPYMFSSDEYAAPSSVSNNRFDSGADPYEKMQYLTSAYENRYIFDYFRRGRVQFTSGGTINRVFGRYFDMITGITKSLGLYTQIYTELYGKDIVKAQILDNIGFLLPSSIASADGFAMFARVLTRPEPGDYVVLDKNGGKYARTPEPEDQQARLPTQFRIAAGSGEGRYINNDYDFDNQGYYWSDYQTRVGTSYEKKYAMEFMLEAYNRFVQVDRRDFVDGRWKNINYATLYPEQMRRLFSSIMQSDAQTLGPYVLAPTGGASSGSIARVQYPSWEKADDVAYPGDAVVLDPVLGWEQQFPNIIYGLFYAPTTLTMDWYDQMRIFVRGGPDDIQVNGPTVEFEDPESRIVYVARDYGTEPVHGRTVARSSGARMIAYAKSLITQAYQTDGGGNVVYTAGKPTVTNEQKALELKRFVSNLAVVRQVTGWFGSGPLGRGE